MEKIPEYKINPNPKPFKQSVVERIRNWYRTLPNKKQYLEFITALLTIPVLLTVLISNISNLQSQKNTKLPVSTLAPVIEKITVTSPPATTPAPVQSTTPTPTPTPRQECVQQVGPIEISYPAEGSTVTGDPVCLIVTRLSQNYCSVVWSYRINGGSWSDYTDSPICMYGLTPGVKNLDLRVNSIISTDTTMLQRTFTVAGATPSPTPTIATSSGTLGN